MKKFVMILGFIMIGSYAHASTTSQTITIPSSVIVSSIAASGGQAQITISTPTALGAFSQGGYTYITNIHIEMYATSALSGGATPVTCTSTGFSVNPAYKFQTAEAVGTEQVLDMQFANPLVATQGTNVVITCPATTNVIWNLQVAYFQGQ